MPQHVEQASLDAFAERELSHTRELVEGDAPEQQIVASLRGTGRVVRQGSRGSARRARPPGPPKVKSTRRRSLVNVLGETKTDVVAPVASDAPAAGRAEPQGSVEPRATADHPPAAVAAISLRPRSTET
jgi:hypothetical protein